MQHPGLDSCIVTEKIVKLSCTVKSLYFTMAEPKRRYLVPGYILPPFEKTSSRCFKINTCQLNQNLQTIQMHTHYTQLYIAGNFPYLTDVVRIRGREWGPTRPSHHLNLFPFMLFCHCGPSKQSLTKCNVFSNFQMSCIATYSFESQSSPMQLITLKATYLPNILRMRVNLLLT